MGKQVSQLFVMNGDPGRRLEPGKPIQVTQRQLVDILVLEEEIKMIRYEIVMKKLRIAAALINGGTVESGLHAATLKGRHLDIQAFRGAILRHEDVGTTWEQNPLNNPQFSTT